MKLKQAVNLLLIALFVWSFQANTVHLNHHVMDEMTECDLCDVSEQFDFYHHISSVMIGEALAPNRRGCEEKSIVRSRFDYLDVPHVKSVDMVENGHYSVSSVSLGFNANAPPVYFI